MDKRKPDFRTSLFIVDAATDGARGILLRMVPILV